MKLLRRPERVSLAGRPRSAAVAKFKNFATAVRHNSPCGRGQQLRIRSTRPPASMKARAHRGAMARERRRTGFPVGTAGWKVARLTASIRRLLWFYTTVVAPTAAVAGGMPRGGQLYRQEFSFLLRELIHKLSFRRSAEASSRRSDGRRKPRGGRQTINTDSRSTAPRPVAHSSRSVERSCPADEALSRADLMHINADFTESSSSKRRHVGEKPDKEPPTNLRCLTWL